MSRSIVLPNVDAVLDAPGLACAGLTPAIRARIREIESGNILEVRTDDPAAREGVPAWSRLTGNELLATVEQDAQHTRFYVRKKEPDDGRERSDDMPTQVLINCTHGNEDPERATLPFIVGNVAVTADQEAVIFLTTEGVRLATTGYADGIQKDGFQPVKELIDTFLANGGEVWACGACTRPRGITDADLIDGAKIVTAANLVEYVVGGAATVHL